jgi:hypothetical protein
MKPAIMKVKGIGAKCGLYEQVEVTLKRQWQKETQKPEREIALSIV